jgi:phenylacetate-CoA ligase
MNQFSNPAFLMKIMKTYLYDIDRLWELNNHQLKKFKDKQFRKMVRFAYNVPVYHNKYKKAGIKPDDITKIEDIEKLPLISKEDIKKYYPEGIYSTNINRENLVQVSTSGTTGKSLTIYVDMFDILMGLFGYMRTLREYGISWRKNRVTIIGDFAPHTAESGYVNRGLLPQLKMNFLLKNIQWLNTNDKPKDVMNELNRFNPDFIGGYVGMLGHLALLKQNGEGKNVSPRYIATTGSVLNKTLKKVIENSFNTHVFEVYGATESGPIAFECKEGKYHIMDDLLHLEFLKNGEPVSSEEPGELVITKLFGKGTPIIRYDAMKDIVAPVYENCNCGLSGGLIKKIYGRDDLALYSIDGKILLPSAYGDIFSKILYELKTNKLKDVRVIQHSLNNIEIQIVIDEKLRKKGPSVEKIINVLKDGFQNKLGEDVKIKTNEVKKIDKDKPRIFSKIKRNEIKIIGYA